MGKGVARRGRPKGRYKGGRQRVGNQLHQALGRQRVGRKSCRLNAESLTKRDMTLPAASAEAAAEAEGGRHKSELAEMWSMHLAQVLCYCSRFLNRNFLTARPLHEAALHGAYY